jgi:hypothetical protein
VFHKVIHTGRCKKQKNKKNKNKKHESARSALPDIMALGQAARLIGVSYGAPTNVGDDAGRRQVRAYSPRRTAPRRHHYAPCLFSNTTGPLVMTQSSNPPSPAVHGSLGLHSTTGDRFAVSTRNVRSGRTQLETGYG